MRVALYARYSSDLQNERSAQDQLGALRRLVAQRGWIEIDAFADEGISGAALANRPGVLRLLSQAKAQAFDLVLAEDLDRLSRDQEGTAHLYKRLTHAGVLLETLSQGRIGVMHVGLAGTMNQLFLETLRHKTKRGLEARVRAGFSGGGRCYGYRLADKGVLEVDDAQAAIVRRIFDDYARGLPPRAIAIALNAEGVPGPRGTWSPTTISGDRRVGDGILCQELYIGVRVFNRRSYAKDPDTGARASRINPAEAWIREAVPQLRLVSDAQWAAVRARHAALVDQPAAYARRPKRILSGKLACAWCGGSMTLQGRRYECTAHRDRGTCSNGKTIGAAGLEARVIEGVRTRLLSPAAIREAAAAYRADMDSDRKAAVTQRLPLERDLAEVGRRIERATESYLSGGIEIAEFHGLLQPLKARKAELEATLARAAGGAQLVTLHPGAIDQYRDLAIGLAEALAAPDGEEVRGLFRQLIEGVDFTPLPGKGRYELTVHGRLAGILQLTTRGAPNAKSPAGEGGASRVSLGAGARSGQNPTTLTLSFAA